MNEKRLLTREEFKNQVLERLGYSEGMKLYPTAEKKGISRGIMQTVMEGKFPDPKNLVLLAGALNVSTDWLLTGKEEKEAPEITIVAESGVSYKTLKDSMRTYPLLSDKVACGPPRFVNEDDIAEYIVGPAIPGKDKVFLMHMKGDSMDQILKDGDIVAIQEWKKDVGQLLRKIVAVWLPEEGLTIKWLEPDEDLWILRPENRSSKHFTVPKKKNVQFFRVPWWIGMQK